MISSSAYRLVAPAPAALHPSSRVPAWVWAGVAAMHVLFLAWQLYHQHPQFPDSDRYLEAARNLREAGVLYARPLTQLPLQPQEYSIRPPGYPAVLALLGAPGQQVPVVLLVLQNLLSFLNLSLMLRWVARHSVLGSRAKWGAVLLLTVAAPAQGIYANVLMSELLLQTAVVVLALGLLGFSKTGRVSYGMGAAVAAAAALLIKPVFYPFALVFLLLSCWSAWRQKRPWLLALGLIPVLVAGAWQWRNLERTGYWHFSSIAEINLLRYNVRAVLQYTEGAEAAEQFLDTTIAAAEHQPSFAAQQRYIQRQSQVALQRHAVAYSLLHLQGMGNFFLDPGRFDIVYFFGLPQPKSGLLSQFSQQGYSGVGHYLRQLPLGLLAVLLAVALANAGRLLLALRFALNRAYPLQERLLLLGLVLYVAVLTGPLGASRFVVPVLPLLLAAAALGLSRPQTANNRSTKKPLSRSGKGL
ncbi:hypothetical protein HMJ29_10060 [Hymenobacter taeanensis]|uniref:Glycosyltransferase RgtA/B/C/D-like domain-containing protein n=1 Tax=Hymenobacter taeanensis TaxID=2735321 RepID=A0A6M6BF97_9BACT|nr:MULTISPECIES: hypothetical protein [Hymenobacter]QJX47261.1 hypothetical protein HMJ29_10060 [Hymenobacter taeanensis]UOQ79403.1 hypothetical protein MUN83_11070 [Hymenobacter sp. 5414T-23]